MDTFDAQTLITPHGVVRFNPADHRPHPFHHRPKIDLGSGGFDTEFARAPDQGRDFSRLDQGLGGDAAGVQAVAAHLVFFYQGHAGLDGSSNIGRHQTGRAGPDNDQIAVKPCRGVRHRVWPLRHVFAGAA